MGHQLDRKTAMGYNYMEEGGWDTTNAQVGDALHNPQDPQPSLARRFLGGLQSLLRRDQASSPQAFTETETDPTQEPLKFPMDTNAILDALYQISASAAYVSTTPETRQTLRLTEPSYATPHALSQGNLYNILHVSEMQQLPEGSVSYKEEFQSEEFPHPSQSQEYTVSNRPDGTKIITANSKSFYPNLNASLSMKFAGDTLQTVHISENDGSHNFITITFGDTTEIKAYVTEAYPINGNGAVPIVADFVLLADGTLSSRTSYRGGYFPSSNYWHSHQPTETTFYTTDPVSGAISELLHSA